MTDDFNLKDVIPDDKYHGNIIEVSQLKHPEKYVGNSKKIVVRSSWEMAIVKIFDNRENVLEWLSEEIAIPYISPIDNRKHNYYPDFYAKVLNKFDKIREWIVEVKPYKETIKPVIKPTHRKTTKIHAMTTFLTNQAKWSYAKEFCQKRNMKFKVITEKDCGF